MELYVTVGFWMGLVALIINICILAGADLPRTKIEKQGEVTVRVILGAFFVFWSGSLIF